MAVRVSTLLNGIRKQTGSESFETSKYGKINEWIDTGSYGLNRIISGDVHRGIPCGRVVLIGGESGAGKSLVCADIASHALSDNDFDVIFYFDSEGGGTSDFFESRGCDLGKIEHVLLDSVEDATIKILNIYAKIAAFKETNPGFKALMILDSLGALVPRKLITDAEKGKQAQDMGLRAKLCNNLIKGCTIPALKTDVSIIILNHIYADPAAMYTSKIKSQGGGAGATYQASIVLQCSKRLIKAEDKKTEEYYTGSDLVFFTTKNRVCRPFHEAEIHIDFSKGVSKYNGLFASGLKYGIIESPVSGYYTVPSWSGDKKWRKRQLEDNAEMWDSVMDVFNTMSNNDMRYSSPMDIKEEQQQQPILTDIEEEEQSPYEAMLGFK